MERDWPSSEQESRISLCFEVTDSYSSSIRLGSLSVIVKENDHVLHTRVPISSVPLLFSDAATAIVYKAIVFSHETIVGAPTATGRHQHSLEICCTGS